MPPTDAARSDEFDAVVEEYHRALDAFITGEPGPMKWLFSRRDDVTLANPFGPPRRGRSEVEETLERAASQLRDGRGLHFEQVSKYVTPELAYIVEFERVPEVKVGGSNEVSRVSLRVTTIFRREDDGWKVVHRQADPITGPRPPESIIEK